MTVRCERPRVAWVALQPAPYILPMFEALRGQREVDLHCFVSDMRGEQPWLLDRYREVIEPASRGFALRIGPYGLNVGVLRGLLRQRWDAMMIAGYACPTMQAAILMCLARRIPFLLQVDTTLLQRRSWLKRAMKRVLLFPVLRRCRAAMGNGVEALRYWHYIGVPKERTFILPLTSHLDDFRRELAKDAGRRDEVRGQWQIGREELVAMYAGRLAREKGLDLLLGGLALIEPARRPHVLLVGDGPERASLEQMAAEKSLPVTFTGFRQNEELPARYAAADFFVLPSRFEPWGVVVAEAMAAGLPVVLSERVGAVADLLEDGRNGLLVRGETPQAWRDALQACIEARGAMKAMGDRSREIAADWTCRRSVSQFLTALKLALADAQVRRTGDIGLEC